MNLLINILVNLLILGIIFAIVDYIIGMIPLFSPFRQIARAILGLIALIYLLGLLFGGVPGFYHV